VLDLECDEARSQGWASAGAKEPVLALKRQPYGAPRIHSRPHLILRRRTTVAVTCQTICWSAARRPWRSFPWPLRHVVATSTITYILKSDLQKSHALTIWTLVWTLGKLLQIGWLVVNRHATVWDCRWFLSERFRTARLVSQLCSSILSLRNGVPCVTTRIDSLPHNTAALSTLDPFPAFWPSEFSFPALDRLCVLWNCKSGHQSESLCNASRFFLSSVSFSSLPLSLAISRSCPCFHSPTFRVSFVPSDPASPYTSAQRFSSHPSFPSHLCRQCSSSALDTFAAHTVCLHHPTLGSRVNIALRRALRLVDTPRLRGSRFLFGTWGAGWGNILRPDWSLPLAAVNYGGPPGCCGSSTSIVLSLCHILRFSRPSSSTSADHQSSSAL